VASAAFSHAASLLERDLELERIDDCVRAARGGAGSLLLIEGSAGIGKSRLLAAARGYARELGLSVLSAHGSELERDFAHGVVRQLFEPQLAAATAADRAEIAAGAASLAAPLLAPAAVGRDAVVATLPAPSDQAFAVLHGLYWLCANLAQRRPLLLTIDDLHWSDLASLRWLAYLSHRLAGLPVAVVVTARPTKDAPTDHLIAELPAAILRPRPLSPGAVAALLEAELGQAADQRFAEACHALTGGTPFLVRELVLALRERGVAPISAELECVRALAPRSVARMILGRLRRLGPTAVRLAQATAVLGTGVELRHAAALAALQHDAAVAASDALGAAGVLEDSRPLSFVHPIVRTVVERDLAAGERAQLHARAARLFSAEPGGRDRVAAHLLGAEPAGDAWVVEALRAAAREAVIRGAPHSGVAYLRRALAEPPAGETRGTVLRELALSEFSSGDERATRHLEEALERASDRGAQVATAMALGRILQLRGEHRRAADVYEQTLRRIGNANSELALKLEAALVLAGLLDASIAEVAARRLPSLRRRAEARVTTPASVFGPLAFAAGGANEPAEQVAALARRALAQDPHPPPEATDRGPFFYSAEAADRGPFFYPACAALAWAEAYDEVQSLFDVALTDAQRLGSLAHFVALSCNRAGLAYRRGALADAEADARQALSSASAAPPFFRALATATLVDVLVERGAPERAEAELAAAGMAEASGTAFPTGQLLCSRGRARFVAGRPGDALADLMAAGRHLRTLHVNSPAVVAWRSDAALAHLALGEREQARALAEEEVALARAFGAPRALGCALRVSGLVVGGDPGIAYLREAVAFLAESGAPLEHARALTDLGGALRRHGLRSEARAPLRHGLELAYRCEASTLAARARTELLATGARPRRPALSGIDALTPSERRVAQMAATGLTNREIAQALFVTARTVEGHLTHVFQKLDVSGRTELAAALPSKPLFS
jgi:DNA-binding CsgD family transcriptional regulator